MCICRKHDFSWIKSAVSNTKQTAVISVSLSASNGLNVITRLQNIQIQPGSIQLWSINGPLADTIHMLKWDHVEFSNSLAFHLCTLSFGTICFTSLLQNLTPSPQGSFHYSLTIQHNCTLHLLSTSLCHFRAQDPEEQMLEYLKTEDSLWTCFHKNPA